MTSKLAWTGKSTVYLFFRPFTSKMLKILARDFELIVFTASQADYASKIVRYLDKDAELFDHLLHREQCLINEKNKIFIKDLSLLLSGRNIEDIIIIDNRVCSYGFDLSNGIPIRDFLGDKTDKDLVFLTNYIRTKLLNAKDVREVI
jgi:CTD small phosphatase-like protein 2